MKQPITTAVSRCFHSAVFSDLQQFLSKESVGSQVSQREKKFFLYECGFSVLCKLSVSVYLKLSL